MKENLEKVKTLAREIQNDKEFPRSARETARAVYKCRANLIGRHGKYQSNCPVDQWWLRFAEIDCQAFRSSVATASTDAEIVMWIGDHAKKRSRQDIVVWNNWERD